MVYQKWQPWSKNPDAVKSAAAFPVITDGVAAATLFLRIARQHTAADRVCSGREENVIKRSHFNFIFFIFSLLGFSYLTGFKLLL